MNKETLDQSLNNDHPNSLYNQEKEFWHDILTHRGIGFEMENRSFPTFQDGCRIVLLQTCPNGRREIHEVKPRHLQTCARSAASNFSGVTELLLWLQFQFTRWLSQLLKLRSRSFTAVVALDLSHIFRLYQQTRGTKIHREVSWRLAMLESRMPLWCAARSATSSLKHEVRSSSAERRRSVLDPEKHPRHSALLNAKEMTHRFTHS